MSLTTHRRRRSCDLPPADGENPTQLPFVASLSTLDELIDEQSPLDASDDDFDRVDQAYRRFERSRRTLERWESAAWSEYLDARTSDDD